MEHENLNVCIYQCSLSEAISLLDDFIPRMIFNKETNHPTLMPSACEVRFIHCIDDEDALKSPKLHRNPSNTMIFLTNHIDYLSSVLFETSFRSIFIEPITFITWTFSSPLDRKLVPFDPTHTYPVEMMRFNNKTIKAGSFPLAPQSVLDFKTGNHHGFEYLIAKATIEALGLSLDVNLPSDGGWWGEETPRWSGNFSGLVGDIISRKIDIGWANLFSDPYRSQYITFTDWYLLDEACFLIPSPPPYPKILALIWPFDSVTWSLTIVFALSVSSVLTGYVKSGFEEKAHRRPWVMFILSVMLKQSNLAVAKIRHAGLRFLMMTFILGMLLLTMSYGAGLITFLSTNVHPEPPNTHDELEKYVIKKDLGVSVCCDNMLDALEERKDSNEIKQRMKIRFSYVDSYRNVSKGSHIIPGNRKMLEFAIRDQLSNE